MWAERKQFIGMVEAIATQRIVDLSAGKNRLTMGATEQQVLGPILSMASGTGSWRSHTPCLSGPRMLAALATIERVRSRIEHLSTQHALPFQTLHLSRHKLINYIFQLQCKGRALRHTQIRKLITPQLSRSAAGSIATARYRAVQGRDTRAATSGIVFFARHWITQGLIRLQQTAHALLSILALVDIGMIL